METDRREFLKTAGVAAASLALASRAFAGDEPPGSPITAAGARSLAALYPGSVDASGEYTLPKLPYAYDALEAAIDAKTMELHHTKHHQAYVDGAKKAAAELAKARESGDFALVEHWSRKLSFNAGGHLLHCIFWDCMGPNAGGAPSGALAEAIARDFGSHDAMWKQFAAAAKAVEGSGWARLSFDLSSGRLTVLQAQNQNLLTTFGEVPLLVLDVWEHAYYLRYQNKRPDYVDAFAQVIDWKRVGARFDLLK